MRERAIRCAVRDIPSRPLASASDFLCRAPGVFSGSPKGIWRAPVSFLAIAGFFWQRANTPSADRANRRREERVMKFAEM
jgi:hypothetical protein